MALAPQGRDGDDEAGGRPGGTFRRRSFLLSLLAVFAFPGWCGPRCATRSWPPATALAPNAAAPIAPKPAVRGLTASGKRPHPGVTVAADWAVFPVGTRLVIQDIGHRVVQDRGQDIVGPRIDIFFRSHAEALAFGRRRVRIRVVR